MRQEIFVFREGTTSCEINSTLYFLSDLNAVESIELVDIPLHIAAIQPRRISALGVMIVMHDELLPTDYHYLFERAGLSEMLFPTRETELAQLN